MSQKSNKKVSFLEESLNRLFRESQTIRDSEDFENHFNFITRIKKFAPFNNYLVFLQNPEATFYDRPENWAELGRKIVPRSRPMLVLRPFGPVDLVFDIKDTEGPPLSDLTIRSWFKTEGSFDKSLLKKLLNQSERLGIKIRDVSSEEYFYRSGRTLTTEGVAVTERDKNAGRESRKIILKPGNSLHGRDSKEVNVQSVRVFLHELGHHLLGHQGAVFQSRKTVRAGYTSENDIILADDRRKLNKYTRELEAESLSHLVLTYLGLENRSAEYLAQYYTEQSVEQFDVSRVLKTANRIIKGSLLKT